MSKEIQRFFEDQMEDLEKNPIINQNTPYARHFKKTLDRLA